MKKIKLRQKKLCRSFLSEIKIQGAGAAAANIFEAEAIFFALSAEALFGGEDELSLACGHILPGKLREKSLLVGLKPRLFLEPCEENVLVDIVIHIFPAPFFIDSIHPIRAQRNNLLPIGWIYSIVGR